MIKASDDFNNAIVADARRIRVRASVAIIDPDLVYGAASSSGAAPFSKLKQLYDRDTDIKSKYQSLELNRFILDGTFSTMKNNSWNGEVAYCSNDLCNDNGLFEDDQFVELRFSGVDVLQSASVFFANDAHDGIPEDFRVDVLQNGVSYFNESFSGNKESTVTLKGFTVYNPTAIRVTITKWSLPHRRARVAEIVPGVYEEWSGDEIASLEISQKCDLSNLSLPYGTCTIKIDNQDRRFEPRSKNGLFQSIEERQGIEMSLGVDLPDGTVEWISVGTYFQYDKGWKTGDNGITITWNLVDIVGLLVERRYKIPDVLPETVGGWVESVVKHLGKSFYNKYRIDENYADIPCIVRREAILDPDPDTGEIKDRTCGEILRMVCMTCGVFTRADSRNGFLTVEPVWNDGNTYDLDNIEKYPVMSANGDVATIEVNGYEFSGNEISSSESVSIDNPFLLGDEQINGAVRSILAVKGGNVMTTVGRGNPTSECGDIGRIWLDGSQVTTGRVVEQTFSMSSGVLKSCNTKFLQADGSFLWENRRKFISDGTFRVPDGVSQVRLILVGHGQDGTNGHGGTMTVTVYYKEDWTGFAPDPETYVAVSSIHMDLDKFDQIDHVDLLRSSPPSNGSNGNGGKVWTGVINVNPNEELSVHIGVDASDPTTVSVYSSDNGIVYKLGYADINASEGFARTGIADPIPGSGDGGRGGRGGTKAGSVDMYAVGSDYGVVHWDVGYVERGSKGATGCAILYWEDVT